MRAQNRRGEPSCSFRASTGVNDCDPHHPIHRTHNPVKKQLGSVASNRPKSSLNEPRTSKGDTHSIRTMNETAERHEPNVGAMASEP